MLSLVQLLNKSAMYRFALTNRDGINMCWESFRLIGLKPQ